MIKMTCRTETQTVITPTGRHENKLETSRKSYKMKLGLKDYNMGRLKEISRKSFKMKLRLKGGNRKKIRMSAD